MFLISPEVSKSFTVFEVTLENQCPSMLSDKADLTSHMRLLNI